MKFYIASKLENAENVIRIANVLKARGWIHTYDWTKHGSVQKEGEQRIKEVAQNEIRGVKNADIVIVLLPGGRGTHAELGAANVLDIPVFIHASDDSLFLQDGNTCAFYWNSNVTRVIGDELELLEEIFAYENALPKEYPGNTYSKEKE